MENIILNDVYFIEIDNEKNDYTLKKRTQTKDGREAYKAVGYYSTLGGALMGYRRKAMRQRLSEGIGLTLDKAIAEVKALDADMRALMIENGLDASGKLY